jgi:transcriptional regulator with XRE-family HTH domain
MSEESYAALNDEKIAAISMRIKQSRENAKISKQEMADEVGLGYEQYRRIESGTVLIKTEYLMKLSESLNVSSDYLLFGDDEIMLNRDISALVNGLSREDKIKAFNVLVAVFG